MVTREQFVERTITYIRSTFPLDPTMEIPRDESLVEIGILDSYSMLDIITFFETEFGIITLDEEVSTENFGSIDNMADFFVSKNKQV